VVSPSPSILGVNAVNRALAAFYDIHGRKREMLFYQNDFAMRNTVDVTVGVKPIAV
jgi:hypothetical protein